MEVTIGGADHHVHAEPGATWGDLAAAAGVPTAALGRSPSARLADDPPVRGAVLDAPRARPGADPARPAAVVGTVGGLDAGRRAVLGAGVHDVGRDPACALAPADPTVSRRHARLHVRAEPGVGVAVAVDDLGSRNGTWAGDRPVVPGHPRPLAPGEPVRLGATVIAVLATDPGPPGDRPHLPPSAAGTVAVNRPPRPPGPDGPPPVVVPAPPQPPAPTPPLGATAVIGPVAVAAVLVAVLGNPLFAALALLSPAIAAGAHLEGRRRDRRARRLAEARRAADLDRLAADLAAAVAAERARREAAAPHLAEVLRRAEQPSTALWERRPGDPDFLVLRVGTGEVPWHPRLDASPGPGPLAADAARLVAAAGVLPGCPATVALDGTGVVGVAGPRAAALAVARSLLCQAAVHHGPADLPVAVACTDAADWEWAKWLPHVDDGSGGRRLAAGREAAAGLAAALQGCARRPLLVVDGDELLAGRRAPLRALLGAGAAGIVVAGSADRLPAACTAVLAVDIHGDGALVETATGLRLPLRADGVAADTAERCARALARFEDPELDVPGAGLPATVPLLALLDLPAPTAAELAARWRQPSTSFPIGVDAHGALELDLVADGPHALVAGTTGAGKSELLRTLVAALAARAGPDSVTFLLIDFKGGSAFDACARLPHVVGVVTDLDSGLAARALRCLEAELRHREAVLRTAGVADLAERPQLLPRLVVVVDEFATLRAELPGFVDALVDVARRGRSLGVHLVLATQRPAGAVSDAIRANAALRIALRVQDPGDSADVVEVPDAARLPRHRPGRACVRLGPGEVTTVQTAHVSGRSRLRRDGPVVLTPFRFADRPAVGGGAEGRGGRGRGDDGGAAGPSDLERLVDACTAAWAGRPPPRPVWPDPLPERLDREALGPGEVALVDDPDRQAQHPCRWDPADGHLLVCGAPGSGTTTTLLAVAVAAAEPHPPGRLHLYAVDCGAGGLAPLARLPHTGSVLAAADRERHRRLVRWLLGELERRRARPAAERDRAPAVVVLVDGAGALLAGHDPHDALELAAGLERLAADGPDVGIALALTAHRPGAVPAAIAAAVARRWVHALADPAEHLAAGLAATLGPLPPGRFVDAATGLAAQVAVPAGGWDAAVDACAAAWAGHPRTAPPVGTLPRVVPWTSVGAAASLGARPWVVPVGVADDDLRPAALRLWEGDHVLVAGPARSGRSTALAVVAHAVVAAGGRALVVVGSRQVRGSGAALPAGAEPVEPGGLAAALAGEARPTVVLVDDADLLDDDGGVLAGLVATAPDGVNVVAAARADAVRSRYDHWLRAVRRSRLGLLLQPDLDLDGDLLGTSLPRRLGVAPAPGRGFLVVDGEAVLVQVAVPPPAGAKLAG